MGHNLRRINFRFNDLVSKCDTIKHTQRNLLCISGSIFDPLGFIAPVTAKIKTIFQLLCKDKLDWGEIIPEEIAIVWNKIVEELKHLAEVRHSRFVFAENFSSDSRIELHRFCDSSNEVYCAVVYLRLVYQGAVHVCFLASKTKVAPFKALTIPRLELLECLRLSKLSREVLLGVEKRIKFMTFFVGLILRLLFVGLMERRRVGDLGLRIGLWLYMHWLIGRNGIS